MTHPSVPQVDRSALLAVLAEQPDDTLQELLRTVSQAAIQAQFEEFVGVDRYLRSDERRDYRNGSRERRLDTRLGTITLEVPRTRNASFRPTLFEHRRRSESALIAAATRKTVLTKGSTLHGWCIKSAQLTFSKHDHIMSGPWTSPGCVSGTPSVRHHHRP